MGNSEKRARRDRDSLRAFALELMGRWADGSVTYEDVEHLAEKHGLLVEQTMTYPCVDNCTCWQLGRFPHPCLRFTSLLTGDLKDPAPAATEGATDGL